MDSRERVRLAINHKEPDRVPIDLGGSQVTGIHVDEYCELAKHYMLDVLPPKVYDPWQMLAIPDYLMLKTLSSDIMVVENYSQSFGLKGSNWKTWDTYAGNTVLMSGGYMPEKDEKGYLHLKNKKRKKHCADVTRRVVFRYRRPDCDDSGVEFYGSGRVEKIYPSLQ